MIARAFRIIVALMLGVAIAAGAPVVVVTGQILDYEQGYVFFTTGDGFRVAPSAPVLDFTSQAPTSTPPVARDWVRATFDATGTVVKLEVSAKKLPAQGDLASVHQYAVALSSPQPNPDLGGPLPTTRNGVPITFSGKPVLVSFDVVVPPTTPQTATIYLTTDQSGWDPQAIRLDRIDALHFRVTRRISSGTKLSYLYTRGSLTNEEVGENLLEREPRVLLVTDADIRTQADTVYAWADQGSPGQQPLPQSLPTPYNPNPFVNLPTPIPPPTAPPPKQGP
jgi:hypothetical protein